MENVLGLSDSFISCYTDDMALFKIEAHFPFFGPFIECVKVFLECSCIYLIIIIIVTSFAPISSKIKLSGATKPGD